MDSQKQIAKDVSPLEIITQHVRHKYRSDPDTLNWKDAPEFPQPRDLMTVDPPPLPAGPSSEQLFDKNAYLQFQYCLNRFEGTELLRRAVNRFKYDPTMREDDNDFYIYTQVHVQGYLFARPGPACRISFSTERSTTKVIWKQSTRLTAGTLVVLSPSSDNFDKQCFVAVVAARYLLGGLEPNPEDYEDENTAPRIEIFWANCEAAVFDPGVEMVMLEAKGGYFETVRHAMVGLQHAANFDSKFDKYIIDGLREEFPAAYLTESPTKVPYFPESTRFFDSSQKSAFDCMTSRELAVIQGPPGTGKTFTSVVALESYVKTLRAGRGIHEAVPPIIVSAQTNHALDQLLNQCSSFEAIIARLGGRTEDEAISARTLYNIRRDSKLARNPTRGENARKKALSRILQLLTDCFPAHLIPAEEFRREGLLTREQYDSLDDDEWECAPMVNANGSELAAEASSIAQWLDGCIESDQTYVYRPPTDQAEPPIAEEEKTDDPKQEKDKERLHGEYFPIKFNLTGSVPGALARGNAWCYQARRLLSKNSDLYEISPPQRGMVYRLLRMDLISARARRFPGLLKEYQEACDEVIISRSENDVRILKEEKVEIVGCTTTGLTKYRGLIAALKPRILMIEEAAETREANITSALYPTLDQIVLVGDHKQLVPQVDVRELIDLKMNVSLFERLVDLGLPYKMLKVQRRMVPVIRAVVNTFYLELEDHPSVTDPSLRPPVPGMGGKNLWWFNHKWSEMQNVDDFSFSNVQEADMIVRFVRYLVQNGVHSNEITILAFYKGQVTLLFEKLRRDSVLAIRNPTKEWSVRTVDGFQGEENEIIILSIVRSARPGFVSNENRAVVATSRAKCGMYIFGNCDNLVGQDQSRDQSRETWAKVYRVFLEKDCIGQYIPVTCKNHGRVTKISEIDGWDTIPGAGCDLNCGRRCPEGHLCQITCHPFEQSEIKCRQACERILDCGHNCGAICSDSCRCLQQCRKPPVVTVPLRGRPKPGPPQIRSKQAARGGERGGKYPSRGSRGGLMGSVNRGHPKYHSPAMMGQTVQSVHGQEPTFEDLIEGGYYSQIVRQSQPTHVTMGPFNAEGSTVQPSSRSESDGFPSIEATVPETSPPGNWSLAKVSQNDKAMRDEVRHAGKRHTPIPPVIREIFHRTIMRPDGSRQRVLLSCSTRPHQTTGGPSRKQTLLDAAAGGCGEQEYSCFQIEESMGGTSHESDSGGSEDLISFE
ncbi:nonsense-mediated mRNA decay protein [Fusarium heterosporum]|uniref:Nonsense-mediated mRNA decay protein n=1 Tax=Fusarium heterosporum TaxID=42747 RepID=A0A8H5X1X5_FUSHE|nr:nonsense-mediated mRNA decay protein [Fusarium heterosporum]